MKPRGRVAFAALRSGEFLSIAVVAVLAAGLVATTAIVFTRVAEEFVDSTESSIASRLTAVNTSIVNVLSLAADEAMNIMSSTPSSGSDDADYRRGVLRERLGKIQAGLIGCTAAWIVPRGEDPVVSPGTPRTSVHSGSWWRAYLDLAGTVREGTFGNLGIRRNLGFVAKPFRGSTGIGTILPVVIPSYVGTELAMTAFFEIDMTVILEDIQGRLERGGVPEYPVELSFYDGEGMLVETTRNLPLVKVPPFAPGLPGSTYPGPGKIGRGIGEYLFPGERSIEASIRDERLDLVCLGRVPAAVVMQDALRVATKVLVVGALAMVAVLMLGIMLMQAFRRARSFEKEQLVARFEALQAKINPHFLFNTLDSMVGLVETGDRERTLGMIRSLSSMLHATVRSTGDLVTVAQELEYVRAYISIQEVRYRERFTWELDAQERALAAPVFRFAIQPLVENCCIHGVHEGSPGMRIAISVVPAGDAVEITVSDDGPGAPAEVAARLRESFERSRNRTGHEGGLFNVHDRARMMFGSPYGLELVPVERGFSIRLRIPAAAVPEQDERTPHARRGRMRQ